MEVFRKNIGGRHVVYIASAFSGKGAVKGYCHKAPFCHLLGIQTGRLFFHCAEGTAEYNGAVFFVRVKMFRQVQVTGNFDAVPVLETDHLCLDFFINFEHTGIVC